MATQTIWSCRDAIQSSNESQYPVKEDGEKSCWEIVKEVDAFSFNVCGDCLIYVADQKSSVLSQNDIENIMNFKGVDFLSGNHCQQLTNAVGK